MQISIYLNQPNISYYIKFKCMMSMLQSVISPTSTLFRDDVVALVVYCEKTNIITAFMSSKKKLY